MDQVLSDLAQLLDRPETHRMVLNGYAGEYSLGITRCENGPGGYGFLLRVRDDAPPDLPTAVRIAGREIPLKVQKGFVAPRPL